MSTLTAPLTLRSGVELPHRVGLAPLTNVQSNADGTLSKDELRWLERRARGGFGLISTCASYISDEGKAWAGQLGISSGAHVSGLMAIATSLRAEEAVPIAQLHHAGAVASLAPQRLGPVDADGVRAATEADIERVVDDFVSAAKRAQMAGFSGVELHGANGYLLTQFLSPQDNTRGDRWGGDLEGRARLLRTVVQAVRAATEPAFAVGVRISPVDTWMRRGLLLEEGLQVGCWIDEDGLDFVHLSLSDALGSPPHEDIDLPVVSAFREALAPDMGLLCAGGIRTRDQAQQALDLGADVVMLGRAGIAHPDWVSVSQKRHWSPKAPPYSPDYLKSVDVGPAFVDYLRSMSGMVTDGKAAR